MDPSQSRRPWTPCFLSNQSQATPRHQHPLFLCPHCHHHHFLSMCPHHHHHHHHRHHYHHHHRYPRLQCPSLTSPYPLQNPEPTDSVYLQSNAMDSSASTQSFYPTAQMLQTDEHNKSVEEEDEEPMFVLTDEWREFFAKSEAKRKLEKKQAKKKGKN